MTLRLATAVEASSLRSIGERKGEEQLSCTVCDDGSHSSYVLQANSYLLQHLSCTSLPSSQSVVLGDQSKV